jgi:hypothetical protein
VAIAELAIGLVTLLEAAALARQPLSSSEARVFHIANSLPARGYPLVWIPMQYGTFGAIPVAATLALACHRPRLARLIGDSGIAAWLSAKGVKSIVDRGRPASVLKAWCRGERREVLGGPRHHLTERPRADDSH